jgi:cobyrinic acid a,c-diamide synthase
MKTISAFVIAGTHSGVGKTTVALGVMAALKRRGLKVQPFKIGPDFIDPGLHAKVCGLPSYNLDGWMLSPNYNRRTFHTKAKNKDVAVVEGMMGLYDGRNGATDEGSTAQMSKHLDLPVVLVVDTSAMARSAAAMILGYQRFDPKIRLIGVIFNRVAGSGHLAYLKEALRALPRTKCFGGIPSENGVRIPERHLGLIVAEERLLTHSFTDRLARFIEAHVDLDRLLESTRIELAPAGESEFQKLPKDKVPIAVARDPAFCFYYPDNLALIENAGAKIKTFSPIRDQSLPEGVRGIYLGGGYPELYAHELSRNRELRVAIKHFIEGGGAVYAECGGLMYLAAAIIDQSGKKHPMVGAYPFTIRMRPNIAAIGYREIVTAKEMFAAIGEKIRGHEFRYSNIDGDAASRKIETVYFVNGGRRAKAREGFRYKNCLGSYVHLHFGSNPEFARSFVAACRKMTSLQ